MVSIIVPVFNAEKHIARCLGGLAAQKLAGIELLFINDGSTDSSLAMLEKWKSENPNLNLRIITQKNQGVAAARNVGLDEAGGKYIMFCDSDDLFEPNACERMVSVMEADGELAFAQCCVDVEVGEGDHSSARLWGIKSFTPEVFGKVDISDPAAISQSFEFVLWNKIFRKSIIDEFQIRFPIVKAHEDDAFMYMLRSVAKSAVYIEDKLYHHLIREDSLTSDYFRRDMKLRDDRTIVCAAVCEFFIRHKFIPAREATLVKILSQQLRTCLPLFSEGEMGMIVGEINKKYLEQQGIKLVFMPAKFIHVKKS